MRLQGPSAEADNTAVDLSFLAQAVQLTANVNDSAVSFNVSLRHNKIGLHCWREHGRCLAYSMH